MVKYSLPQPIPLPNPYSLFRGFNFIRPIRIENSGAALRDYQVKITLTQDNFPFEKCRPDGNDIRFRDDSGEIVSYWTESWTITQAVVWCKVPYIPEDSSTFLWMVYGNPTAESQSNVSQTFIREINGGQPVRGSWQFDESYGSTTYDSSGYDNHGTLVNGPMWCGGKFGYALDFNGSNSYVNCGTDSSITEINNNFAMEMWVYPEATHEIDNESTSGWSGTSGQRYALGLVKGEDVWGSGHAGAGISIGTNGISVYEHADSYLPSLLVYQGDIVGWNHVIVVYDDKQPKLYLNGGFIKNGLTSPKTYVHPGLYDVCGIGGMYYGYFDGKIDSVRLYNRILTTEEIHDLANYYGYTTTNYPGRVLIRKYTYPEPTIIL